MWFKRIEIHGFRNIEQAVLEPCNGYNLIIGSNGSGKTSILEAIQCISTGRSFRTNKKLPVIHNGRNHATVYAELVNGEAVSRAGLQKRRDGTSLIKVDGRNLESQMELALLLPVLGFTPESDDLLSEGAKVRQAYLDWTLFHVEQNFRELWKNYRRVLHQRNQALKSPYGISAIISWDSSLVEIGNEVDRLRKQTLSRLLPILKDEIHLLLPDLQIAFSFRQGWPKEITLAESLTRSFEIDKKMGFTHSGPHRADILIKTELGSITQVLSRGQKKLLMIALKIAQIIDYQQQTGKSPVLYVDDMTAELDLKNREILLGRLVKLNIQIFVTATSSADVAMATISPVTMFHVEQGRVMNMI